MNADNADFGPKASRNQRKSAKSFSDKLLEIGEWAMKLFEEGLLLRIFIGERDMYKGRPLHQQIVKRAKKLEMAGATVTRGMMGFGARSRLHTAKLLRLSQDMPLIIEIIDSADYIKQLLPYLDKVMTEGLVTIENVKVIKYGNRQRENE